VPLPVCEITPRGFTSETEYSFWGFIPTNKQTNNQQQRFSQHNLAMLPCTTFVSDAHYCHGCENDDTEHANFKSQYCEQNVSRSRHMVVQSACKIYWQGVNICARVDGFGKNVSQNTWQSSPQPVNCCLAWLLTLKLLDLQKNEGDNDYKNCPRVTLVGDWKITGHKDFFSNNKNIVILGKLVTHNSNFEKNSDTQW